MALTKDPNHVYRDWPVEGVPDVGKPYQPKKEDIRQLLSEYQETLIALVAEETGLTLPNLLIRWTINNSDANDLTAEAQVTPPDAGLALNVMAIQAANTGQMTLNGKPILSNMGAKIGAGYLKDGMLVLFFDHGTHWRLISDVDAAAILDNAHQSAEAAQASASVAGGQAAAAAASADEAKKSADKAAAIAGFEAENYTLKKDFDTAQNSFVGQVAFFPYSSPPDGWIKANGALLSRTTFALLYNAAQKLGIFVTEAEWTNSSWGAFTYGDGSTTFRIPDLRGEFLRAWDDGRGVDTGRIVGNYQGDTIRNIKGAIHAVWSVGTATEGAFTASVANYNRAGAGTELGQHSYYFDASRTVPTAAENRPRNIALLACIKY